MWLQQSPVRPPVVIVIALVTLTGACARGAQLTGIRSVGDTSARTIDLFVAGRDGYHTYRIPALVATPAGTLLAFVEGRKDDGKDHGDIDLLLKRSTDGGRTWSAQQTVYEEGGTSNITIGNPSPVVDANTGTIWLPFTRDNRDVLVTHSTNDGVTWAPPRDITPDVKRPGWGWYATGPGVGIQLHQGTHRGRLLIPCDHSETVAGRSVKHSHVFYSDDHGRTWQLGGTVAPHTDECQLAELSDDRIVINMRNYWGREGNQPERGGMRAVAWSRDGGQSWSPLAFDQTLVEPVCQASLVRYRPDRRGDRRLLFSNPAHRDARVRLTIRLSEDDGRSWPAARVLESGPSAYSSLAILADGTIGALYERGGEHPYEKITFARLSFGWLVGERNGR